MSLSEPYDTLAEIERDLDEAEHSGNVVYALSALTKAVLLAAGHDRGDRRSAEYAFDQMVDRQRRQRASAQKGA